MQLEQSNNLKKLTYINLLLIINALNKTFILYNLTI